MQLQSWRLRKNLYLETHTGSRKLMPKFCGPFRIIETIKDITFRLDLPTPWLLRRIHNVFHARLLRKYTFPETGQSSALTPVDTPDGKEYEVESIIRHRKFRGRKQYLVKWKGYPDNDSTWQSKSDLKNSAEILQQYQASCSESTPKRRKM